MVAARLTLFVPGRWPSEAECARAVAVHGLRLARDTLRVEGTEVFADSEWIPADGTFASAFSFGTVSPAKLAEIGHAPGALVLTWSLDLLSGRASILGAVERLRDAGALAVRVEQSKVGYDVDRWLELIGSGFPRELHRAVVAMLGDADCVQSCGMHAFSRPDACVSPSAGSEAAAALLTELNVYQLAEDPLLRSGQTFRPSEEEPRRVLERWPDAAYPASSPCHNPYGVWRLSEPGVAGRASSDLLPVFIPSLAAVLMAAEESAGRALTKAEVEATRNRSACVMMKQRDAQRLERERGYADLEPELAWEQWRAMRGR